MSVSYDLGIIGENQAAKFLQKKGYRILERNFRSRFGEIDLICKDEEVLVFVEVKTRWSQNYGRPEEAITPWKIRKIIMVTKYYQMLHPDFKGLMRIDAVAIDLDTDGKLKEIKLIKNITG